MGKVVLTEVIATWPVFRTGIYNHVLQSVCFDVTFEEFLKSLLLLLSENNFHK